MFVMTGGPAISDKLAIDIVFLGREEAPVLPLSFVEPEVTDPAIWGARLAAKDNQTTGGFLGHEYSLTEDVAAADADIAAVVRTHVDAGRRYFVSDLNRADLMAVVEATAGSGALIFNGRVGDDDLRKADCSSHVFHTALSRAMRADALIQFLAAKRWTRLFLVSGTQPNDRLFADAIRQSAKKFGAKIVDERDYEHEPLSRRTDSGHVQIQRQMPVATQSSSEHDVLIVADESEAFGEYVPHNTWSPRPVAGTHGLSASSWHRVQEQWGSTQIQRRFEKIAGRPMQERDYGAWLAIRSIGEAVTRVNSADPKQVRDYLRGPDFALGGFKGTGLSFRPWNQQMRQAVLIVNKRVLISASPQQGFLHERTPLDSLGFDAPEVECQLN